MTNNQPFTFKIRMMRFWYCINFLNFESNTSIPCNQCWVRIRIYQHAICLCKYCAYLAEMNSFDAALYVSKDWNRLGDSRYGVLCVDKMNNVTANIQLYRFGITYKLLGFDGVYEIICHTWIRFNHDGFYWELIRRRWNISKRWARSI